MTDLLNKGEYAALAADIKFYVEPFIDGKYQESRAGNIWITGPYSTCTIKLASAAVVDLD